MKKYDVVIIGSGPAGMTAALYATRTKQSVLIIDKGAPGGKLVNISYIDNFIGDRTVVGADLALRMYEHMMSFGAETKFGNVTKVNTDEQYVVVNDEEKVEYKYLIIASGTSEVVPEDVKGIHEYNHKGVSYCAICDGPLYSDKEVAIIGGGNSAVEEGIYLSSVAKKVHMFVRSEIKADWKIHQELLAKKNVVVHNNESILEITGDNKVEKVITKNGEYEISAVFPYVGLKPNTEFLEGTKIKMNKGFIEVDRDMRTNIKTVFSVGDINTNKVNQITTAIADGTIAARIITNEI